MSCISKILEVKGDKELIINNNIAIEGGGIYKDYEYLITFTSNGHRCGYVAITSDHPFHILRNDTYNLPDISVHGGVTFFEEPRFEDITGFKCTDKWIGFDCAHLGIGGDIPDLELANKIFPHMERELEFMKAMELFNPKLENLLNKKPSIKSYEYVEDVCKDLIDQLMEKAA